jgi:hypothetical protein
MSSNIDIAIPPFGNATTAGVRANFTAAKQEIEELQKNVGYADYNDSATSVTPISVSSNTWTKLTNNKLGANTQIHLPDGITNLWNPVTNQMVLTEVPVHSMVDFRADIEVTTSSANQPVRVLLEMAIGDAIQFSLPSNDMTFKSAGSHKVVATIPFYVGSDPVKSNPSEFRIWSDASCTVKVNGWYIRIIKHLGIG